MKFVTARHSSAKCGTVQYGTAQLDTAWYGTAVRCGTGWSGAGQRGTARGGMRLHGTVHDGTGSGWMGRDQTGWDVTRQCVVGINGGLCHISAPRPTARKKNEFGDCSIPFRADDPGPGCSARRIRKSIFGFHCPLCHCLRGGEDQARGGGAFYSYDYDTLGCTLGVLAAPWEVIRSPFESTSQSKPWEGATSHY